MQNGTAQIPAVIPAPPWLANGPASQWISSNNSPNAVDAGGVNYTYTLQFIVGSLANLITANISGRYASDDETTAVLLNGVGVPGFVFNNGGAFTAFDQWHPFAITNAANFQLGLNTLSWTVRNGGVSNPTGLRVEFTGSNIADLATPEPSSILLGGLGLVGLGMVRRRRGIGKGLA